VEQQAVNDSDDDDPDAVFVPGPRARAKPLGNGRLGGLNFAAKDVFDVAGTLTTYGNPDWARTHPPAPSTAPAVRVLLEAGATLVGKTKTVELAYGLAGENVWHGTPRNPAAPDRLPGGSSCGSAAAVAGQHVDFALGTDTGGSVRIPASYCGLFGFRPSFGAISAAGVCPLAPSMDTVGWLAPSASRLTGIGEVLLPGAEYSDLTGPLLRLEEAWVNAQLDVAEALRGKLERVEHLRGRTLAIRLAPEGLDGFYDHFRAVQAEEIWASLGGWITSVKPRLGPAVADRIEMARTLDPEAAADGRAFRRILQARIRPLLAGGVILALPTSPCIAPLTSATPAELEAVRQATMGVTAIASLCGLPEVSLPAAMVRGAPVGLSLIAGHGRDKALLAFACDAASLLGLPV
jgi:amidase